MTRPAQLPSVKARQGRRAGIVSRAAGSVVDLLIVFLIDILILLIVAVIRPIFGGSFGLPQVAEVGGGPLYPILLLLYLTYGWGLNGQTFGKILVGLRVVRSDGSDVSFVRGFLRALTYIVFPIGLLWALVSRRNASLQDLLIDTAVVHDWGFAEGPARAARATARARESL